MRLRESFALVAVAYASPSLAQESASATPQGIEARLAVLEERHRGREAVALQQEKQNEARTRAQAAQREADDLIAQQRMAASTEKIANLTRWQLILAGLTAIGLAVSIYFTRISLAQTAKVIADNKRYSESELRAYVGLHEISVENYKLGETVSVRVCFKNYGSTPALNVRSWSQRDHVDLFPTSKEHEMPDKLEFKKSADIPPGGTAETRFFVTMKLAAEMELAHIARKKSIGLFTVMIYDDVFGEQHVFRHSEFRSDKALYRSRKNPAFLVQQHPDIPMVASDEVKTTV